MVQSLDENYTKEVNNNFLLYPIYGNFNIITKLVLYFIFNLKGQNFYIIDN